MPYPLPLFVSKALAEQPTPPRQVATLGLIRAVLGGTDCAVFAGFALAAIACGLGELLGLLPNANAGAALTFAGVAAIFALPPAFRIWSVRRALRAAEADIAEVVTAQVGPVRGRGATWGDRTGGIANAAEGTYRLQRTGAIAAYYMQQHWAMALRPGAWIWVLPLDRLNIVFAPVDDGATQTNRPGATTS
jgi:hypothetical protein